MVRKIPLTNSNLSEIASKSELKKKRPDDDRENDEERSEAFNKAALSAHHSAERNK